MSYPLYNMSGKETGSIDLPKEIFEVEINKSLINQVANLQMSNRRQGTANAKGRAEVRGGGRKPWRQKGTGRARHGSSRSPIWRGGGVTFGPTNEKDYKKKINKKLKKKALFMVLSAKAKSDSIIVLDSFDLKEAKTKIMAKALKVLKAENSAIIAIPMKNETIWKASRNIPGISVMPASDLNVLDLLSCKKLILSAESVRKNTWL